jgi:hypothetical protein
MSQIDGEHKADNADQTHAGPSLRPEFGKHLHAFSSCVIFPRVSEVLGSRVVQQSNP